MRFAPLQRNPECARPGRSIVVPSLPLDLFAAICIFTSLRPGRAHSGHLLLRLFVTGYSMATKRAEKRVTARPRARSREVLGTSLSKPSIPEKWRRHYQRLVQLHGYLTEHKGQLVEAAKDQKPAF